MTAGKHNPEIMARIERARALFDSVPADEMVDSVSRLFELQPDEATDEFIYPAQPHTNRARIFGGKLSPNL